MSTDIKEVSGTVEQVAFGAAETATTAPESYHAGAGLMVPFAPALVVR